MFPSNSAFTVGDEAQEYMEGVRKRALSTPEPTPDLEGDYQRVRQALVQEAEEIAERFHDLDK